MSLADEHRKQPGYAEYQRALARVPPAQFPWKTLAGNVAGVGAAHALGYLGAGALMKGLAHTPAGAYIAGQNPKVRRLVFANLLGAAGAVGVAAAGMASLSGQLRVAEEVARLERERHAASQDGNAKVASLLGTYAALLRVQG